MYSRCARAARRTTFHISQISLRAGRSRALGPRQAVGTLTSRWAALPVSSVSPSTALHTLRGLTTRGTPGSGVTLQQTQNPALDPTADEGAEAKEKAHGGGHESSDSDDEDSDGVWDDDASDEVQFQILEASLPHVKEHGWTVAALGMGAEACSLPSVAHGLFPRGPVELVEHLQDRCLIQTAEALRDRNADGVRVRQRLKDAIRIRLEMTVPYKQDWHQALALQSHPENVSYSLRSLALLVDEIVNYSGDRSVNFEWYARRAAVSAIYCSTELFMLTDKSEGCAETWDFLSRRVDDAMEVAHVTKDARAVGTAVFTGASAVADTLFRGSSGRL